MKNSLMPLKGNRFFSKPTNNVSRGVSVMRRSMSGLGEYAALGLPPFASKNDVKLAYKRLALKYHPDVVRDVNGHDKAETFKEIKSAYESLMAKFEEEEEEEAMGNVFEDEWEEWDEWMGFEGGTPVIFNP